MTTKITIKNEEPSDSKHVVRVTTILYSKGRADSREVQMQDVSPGNSVMFFLHALCDLKIEEIDAPIR